MKGTGREPILTLNYKRNKLTKSNKYKIQDAQKSQQL